VLRLLLLLSFLSSFRLGFAQLFKECLLLERLLLRVYERLGLLLQICLLVGVVDIVGRVTNHAVVKRLVLRGSVDRLLSMTLLHFVARRHHAKVSIDLMMLCRLIETLQGCCVIVVIALMIVHR